VYHLKVHSSGVEYLFDSGGRLTGIKDRSKNTFQVTRDASNNVTGVVGTRGGPAVGAPGVTNTARKISITGPSAGQLISQVKQSPNDGSPLAARTAQFSYTGSLLHTVTDAAGRVTTFGYDSNNRLNQITSPAGDSTTGNVTTITYQANDGNGNPDYRVKKVSQVLDGTTTLENQFVIDDAARTNKFTDAAGRFTTYSLDATSGQDRNGRIGKVTDAWGLQVGSTNWSPDSQITKFTNVSNGAASVVYGANNGESPTQLSVDSGAGSGNDLTLGGYGPSGSSIQYSPGNSTNAGGNTSSYRYDDWGNLRDNRDAAGNTAIVERNINGTVKFTTTPNNIGDGSSHGTACQRTDSHTIATVTDNCSLYSYDATSAQLTSITPPDNAGSLGAQQFSYDGFGRRASVTDGRGITLTYSYDALDRLTKVHPSDGTADVSYSYDRDGNLATRTDGAATMTYTYDRVNRLTVQSSNGTSSCPATPDNITQCFSYDKAGNLRSLADGRGITTYHLNDVSELDEMNESTGKTDVFGYNSDHRRTDTYTATSNAVDTVSYNPDHTLVAPTGWASHTHNTLDNGGRLTNTTTTRGGPSVNVAVAELDYSYNVPPGAAHGCYPSGGSSDGANLVTAGGDVAANNDYGKRTSQTDNISHLTTTYCYDASGRLTSASDGTTSYTYSYDNDGNRTGETVNGTPGVSHSYNAADQITDAGFSYDAAGNQTAGPDVTTPPANINAYQQTVTMTPAGGTSKTFTYGGTSQTELRSKSGGFTFTNGPTGIMSQTLSGGGILYFERDPSGALISEVWKNGSGALAGEYYYYFDGTGSVIGLIQGNGTQRAKYTYDPYGGHDTATGVNGSLPNNPFRYAGGLAVFTDSNNSVLLYKFGQRYYQPDLGRWTQPDSIDHSSDPSQADPYTYAANDPVNKADRSGTDAYDQCTYGSAEYSIAGNSVIPGTCGLPVDSGDTASFYDYIPPLGPPIYQPGAPQDLWAIVVFCLEFPEFCFLF
jgi:RHS repeat-associated protein